MTTYAHMPDLDFELVHAYEMTDTVFKYGDIIQVDLPTNSIVDLSSLAWSFRNTFSVGADLTDGKKAAAPQNAEAIIERLAIEVNGQTLVNLTNYNMLFHALLYMTATDDYVRSRRVAQTNNSTHTDSGISKEFTGAAGAT